MDGHEKSQLAPFVMALAAAALIAVIIYYVVGFMATWIAAEDKVPLTVTSGELFVGNEFTPSGVAVPIFIDPAAPVIYGDIQFNNFETFVTWLTMTEYERTHGRTRREGP